MDDGLLNTEEAAAYLGIGRSTLEIWRTRDKYGPKFVRLGDQTKGRVLYRREDLDLWIASQVADPAQPTK